MTTPSVTPAVRIQTTHAVVLADGMEGVRAGLRWLLRNDRDLVIVGEAGSVAQARALCGVADVVVSGLRFADGVAADLAGGHVPVVVHTGLPADERAPGWTRGCAAVVRHGALGSLLAPAVRAAAQSSGREPERDIDVAGSEPGSR